MEAENGEWQLERRKRAQEEGRLAEKNRVGQTDLPGRVAMPAWDLK